MIGGTFDGSTTYTIDRVARSVFITGEKAPHDEQSHETKEADIFEDLSEMWFGKDDAQD